MQTKTQNIQWLMEKGSPAIRMRTYQELSGESATQEMVNDLINFPMTQQWLSRLETPNSLISLHGSKPECFENVCAKLRELGIKVSMVPAWEKQLEPFIEYLLKEQTVHGLNDFSHLFIYHPLISLGFDHPIIIEGAITHINQVAAFCQKMDFNIYIDGNTFGGLPSAYKNRKLLDPETNHCLPTIWDIYALAYLPKAYRTPEIQEAEKKIINYILTDDYQSLPEGYGIMYYPPTKSYYAHGWKVYLPGWFPSNFQNAYKEASFIQRVELMACFPQAHSRKWFQNSLHQLESYQTMNGTYRFPSSYLKENNSGYYVTGAYMRLEENRRRKIALELDSTFRMELIKKRSIQL